MLEEKLAFIGASTQIHWHKLIIHLVSAQKKKARLNGLFCEIFKVEEVSAKKAFFTRAKTYRL
jgi:hypothetical protein